jgi:prepilin-type N-terminal cleavage/methylation domain-containing protein
MKHSKGFTLIELLVGMAVMALIAIPLFDIIRGAFETFNRGTDTLVLSADIHNTTPDLGRNLEYSRRIETVSLRDNKAGYIQYVDAEGRTITLFQNSDENQSLFSATNSFSSENIVAVYTESSVDSSPEILVPDITAFQIETYAHSSFSIASANNISTINVDTITSLQFRLDARNKHASDTAEFLVRLSRTPIENDGSHTYGIVGAPFSDLDFNGFTHSGVTTALDDTGGEADGLYLLTPSLETVKIKNTGLYFSSIQAAVDAASAGDTIMVGYRSEGYVENVFIENKENIRIVGGYNPENWTRDPETYPTLLKNRGGFSIDDITAALYIKNSEKCHIESLSIDGSDLRHGVYVLSSEDISLSRLSIDKVDRSVILSQSTVAFSNNAVTGNEYALFVTSTEPVMIERSRFFSFDITKRESTITLDNAGNTVIRNCLILGGFNGIHAKSSSAFTLINSVVDLPENFGVFLQGCTGTTIQNTALCNGTIGLVESPADPSKTIAYNYYLNQEVRASDPSTLSEEANSYVSPKPSHVNVETWTAGNSYFEDTIHYIPRTTGQTLVDNGTGGQDITSYAGSRGTSLNDVGLYGGPYGGRNGLPDIHKIASTDSQATILSTLSNSWPADTILFEQGTYPLTAQLDFKEHQTIMGAGPMDTVISNSATDLMSLQPDSQLSYLALVGDSDNKGIILPTSGEAIINNVVLRDLYLGIETTGASALVSFSTFHTTRTAFRQAGSAQSTLNYSIVAHSNLGFENDSSNSLTGMSNLFHNTLVLFSGSYASSGDESQVASSPLFWDENNDLLQLSPDSNAIDISSVYDAGAFEFFEFSGFVQTPEYPSDIPRDYDQIHINIGGLPSLSAPMSQIEVAYELGDSSVTLSPTVIVSKDITFSHTWDLPPNVITEKLKVNVKMTSFTPGRTPYLNELKVIW